MTPISAPPVSTTGLLPKKSSVGSVSNGPTPGNPPSGMPPSAPREVAAPSVPFWAARRGGPTSSRAKRPPPPPPGRRASLPAENAAKAVSPPCPPCASCASQAVASPLPSPPPSSRTSGFSLAEGGWGQVLNSNIFHELTPVPDFTATVPGSVAEGEGSGLEFEHFSRPDPRCPASPRRCPVPNRPDIDCVVLTGRLQRNHVC